MTTANVDPQELAKFGDLAHRWWDPNSEFRPLHDINPPRLDYIDTHVGLQGKRVVDVGCGGGILSESMAQRGASVLGVDMGEKALGVARLHLLESGTQGVEYRQILAEELAEEMPGTFDAVACLEMLEHVPDPASTIRACAALAKPGGQLFFSTINRNPKAYLFAILGAEYIMNLLPKGTHDYQRFIRPAELTRLCRNAGLEVEEIRGMAYNPFTRVCRLRRDTSINYLVRARRSA